MKLKTFQREEDFVVETVNFIKNLCTNNSTDQTIKIALSGGNTPKPVYQALAKANLPFDSIEFFQVDERYVPEDHTDSNCRMIYGNLIKNTNPHKFHYFQTSLPIEKALQKYQEEITNIQFDLTILGIGPDGHTASLFPNSNALNETASPVAHTQTNEFAVKDRLTLTFPKILESKKLLVLLKGKEKEILIDNLQNPSTNFKDFPAKKLTDHKDLTINLLANT